MTLTEILLQLFLIGIAVMLMASTFWASSPKGKLAPVDGMQVLNDTHALVETGNSQMNHRLGKLEKRIDTMEAKLDTLISLSTHTS